MPPPPLLLLPLLLLLAGIARAVSSTSGDAVIITTIGQQASAEFSNGTQPVLVSDAHSISNPTIMDDDVTLLGGTKSRHHYANDPPLPQLLEDERSLKRGNNLFGVRYNDPFEIMQMNVNIPSQIATSSKIIGRLTSVWARRTLRSTVRKFVRYDKVLRISSFVQATRVHFLSLAGMFRVFAFKGVGLSFVKSAVKLNSFGFGIRIPVTPHFPEYDRLLHLPRISTFAGISYPIDYRFSISASFPLHVVTDALTSVAGSLQLVSASWIESFNSKATDSVKRVGMTLTFRYNPVHRLRVGIGPWWFFLPGQRTMEMVLPVLFFLPAMILAALNLFVAIDPRSFFYDLYTDGGEDDLYYAIPTLDQFADVVASSAAGIEGSASEMEGGLGDSKLVAIRSENAELEEALSAQVQERGGKKYGGVLYWHTEILKWAATKVCGLGYNIGWYRSSDNDRYIGSSVLFDVQPFLFRKLRRSLGDFAPAVKGLFSSQPRPSKKKAAARVRERRKIKVNS